MTREEVIKALIKERKTALHENKQAFDMAIKALEQQPNEDCVSRQAVLERINDWWGITSISGEPTLCDCIRDLPPVTPTRKKGEWVDIHDREEWYGDQYRCSLCGEVTIDNGLYCPNCGAKMEDEE